MPHKCIVWGIGNDYEKIVNQLQFEVAKGNKIGRASCRERV